MGEIIDMGQYRLRKTAQRYLESKGVTIMTAAELLRLKRAREGRPLYEAPASALQVSMSHHPAGKGRHE